MVRFEKGGVLLLALLGLLSQPVYVRAAQHAFDIDVKELDQEKPAPPKTAKKAAKEPAHKTHHHHPATHSPAPDGYVRYTVRPGDHLFKILITQFGISNEKAERLIPEILRENHIDNIKALTVGKVLLIPLERSHHRSETAKKEPAAAHHAKVPESPEPASVVTKPKEEPVHTARAHEPAVKSEPVESKTIEPAPVPVPAAKAAEAAPPLVAVAPPPKIAAPPAAAVPVAAAPVKEKVVQEPVAVAEPAKAAPVSGQPVKPASNPEPVVAKAVPQVPAKGETADPKKETPPLPALPVQPTAASMPLAVPTWICAVPDSDPHHVVDSMLNSLSLKWSKNHVIRSDDGAKTAFSIMVDRYFELKGKRYIITVAEVDPYNYTLLRLLENSGYKVLRLQKGERFEVLGDKLLRLVGVAPAFGNYPVAGSEGVKKGFLLGEDETGGRRILVTREVVGPGEKRVMAEGCGRN